MKIAAILIGNTTVPEPLKGVTADFKIFSSYLKSEKGGAWEGAEIIPLMNPSKRTIMSTLDAYKDYDYLITLVAAHGEHRMPHDETFFLLDESKGSDGRMSVRELRVDCKRQLIIADVCRHVVHETLLKSAALSRTLDFAAESRSLFSRADYRKQFLDLVNKTSHGVITLYSCGLQEGADEDVDGGLYTQALIRAGASAHSTTNILHAHAVAKNVTTTRNPSQKPTENMGRRGGSDDYPPFAIVF